MAALISDRRNDHQAPAIDWETETARPRSLNLLKSQQPPVRDADKGIEVLLTGSTGFLGRAILSSLLRDPSVTRIHCIAVDPDAVSSQPKA
jgi:hypothetical protein